MSIIFTDVEIQEGCKPFASRLNQRKYIQASIDPSTYDQFPFPSDYKYFSCFLPRKYIEWADRIHNFSVRSDDVFVLGFPKSGTTWMSNIVNTLINNLNFQADFIMSAYNLLEASILVENVEGDEEINKKVEKIEKMFDEIDKCPSPRLIKSHLPAYLLPKAVWTVQPKIIYMSRDVRDVAVSLLHMLRNNFYEYSGTDHEFYQTFRSNCSTFAPFYGHIQSFRQLFHLNYVMHMTYEQMSLNVFESVKNVSTFLECKYNDEQLNQVIEHVSFEKMREKIKLPIQKDPNYRFCRNGKAGGFQDEMNNEDIHLFDEYTARQKMEFGLL